MKYTNARKAFMKKRKTAVITLSFDDGRIDTYYVAKELLEKKNIPATINIATGYVEGDARIGKDAPVAMTKENVIEIHNTGLFEIAAHGDLHKNDFEDISTGREKLLSWLGKEGTIGFASPGSVMTVDFINENSATLTEIGLSYARTSHTHQRKRFAKIKTLFRKAARVTGSSILYRLAYNDLTVVDGFAVTSIPVFSFSTVKQLKSIVRLAIKRGALLTLMFHSVCKNGEPGYNNIYSYDWDEFNKLINYLVEMRECGKLKILTTEQALNIRK